MVTFYTAVRGTINNLPEDRVYYMEGHDQGEYERAVLKLDESGDLRVYVGTFDSHQGPLRQVVIASEHPPPGAQDETFELVFVGPPAMAWELFDAHVGML